MPAPSLPGRLSAALACLLALSSCGGSGARPADAPRSASYGGSGSGVAVLVSFTRTGDRLAGSLQRSLIAGGRREAVVQQSYPLVGTVAGADIALNLASATSSA